MIQLTLIRHGETQANRERRYLGITDASLCKAGIAKVKRQWPAPPKTDLLVLSPMKRCAETADLIFGDRLSEIPTIFLQDWTEMNFGEFEMKNYQELNGNPDYQAFIDSGGATGFPGGESREDFVKRIMEGYEYLLAHCKSLDRPDRYDMSAPLFITAIVHGGTIMALASTLTGRDYFDLRIDHAKSFTISIPEGADSHGIY